METRYTVHPQNFKTFTTEKIRDEFLITGFFKQEGVKLVYIYEDRVIVGGVLPLNNVSLKIDQSITGGKYLLERREMGIINVGESGNVIVDEKEYPLNNKDGMYIGMGAEDIRFGSVDKRKPAKFYFISTTAHRSYPVGKVEFEKLEFVPLGSKEGANLRRLYKFIHPEGLKSCQLVMGITVVEQGSVWNTMPCHTHVRRSEVYFYFDLNNETVVFHLFGRPDETRHIVVRNEEAVISPSWSIHSGVGTNRYSFIWAMAGENQLFDDVDSVLMKDLK